MINQNALSVLEQRYLADNGDGKLETPEQMFRRVARNVAQVALTYGHPQHYVDQLEEAYFSTMNSLDFMPNSPTLMNAGRPLQMLVACFVVPVGDSMEEIFDAVKWTALIQKGGGGTGFSFSSLRQEGALVSSTGGSSSGPLSFMEVFNATTNTVKQGGKRRGASMAVLNVHHPDILKFICCKEEDGKLSNFNISVGITREFMDAVADGTDYDLIEPNTNNVVGRVNARDVLRLIAQKAHANGEPGILFLSNINEKNQLPGLGMIEASNPCVSGNTRISTDRGLVKAVDLYSTGYPVRVVTDNRAGLEHSQLLKVMDSKQITATKRYINSLGTTIQQASHVFATGIKPVYRLTTKAGYTLDATLDHKILTPSGYKELGTLSKTDEVLIQSGTGGFGGFGSLGEGRILGWMVGDGSLYHKPRQVALMFYDKDVDLASIMAEHLSEVELSSPKLNRHYESPKPVKQKANTEKYTVISRRYYDRLAELGITEKLRVPEAVFQGSKDMQIGFLQGLFSADGTVCYSDKKQSCNVRLTSISMELLAEVQLLLLNHGIFSKIHMNRRDAGACMLPDGNGGLKEYNCNACHELMIGKESRDKFARDIGFLQSYKQSILDEFMSNKTRATNKDTFKDTVMSIELLGEEIVYDLTEPNTSSFVANGIVVHNCSEALLFAFEACVLGSINLSNMVIHGAINWDKLDYTTRLGTRMLDNIIDASSYPIEEIEQMVKSTRKIGVGIMGLHELLIKLGIPYDSESGIQTAEDIMEFITRTSMDESSQMAQEYGCFPAYEHSIYKDMGIMQRNANTSSVAPTGSISMICGTTPSAEPLFAVVMQRHHNVVSDVLYEVNSLFAHMMRQLGLYIPEVMGSVVETGSVQGNPLIPEEIQRLFKTAHDIAPEWHVRMQAAIQRHTHQGVSKTVNLSHSATIEDVEDIYMMAHELGCKGITVYRDGSRENQVYVRGISEAIQVKAPTEDSQGTPYTCPSCGTTFHIFEGSCAWCPQCGGRECS